MRIFFVSAVILCFGTISLHSHDDPDKPTDANIFGHVICLSDGQHIPFINIMIQGTRIGTVTDATGHYMLTNLPEGKHTLVVRGMGYETGRVTFNIREKQSLEINIEIEYSGVNLEEIVITSSPTARGFRYQPDNVYLGEELQRRAEISFGEMLNGEPGIAMRSNGPTPSRPVIRGLDGDRILILQNGERMGDVSETSAGHAISLDPLSSNRVEVVRGPASLLYGSSAIGGVINLMTMDIPENWDHGSSGVVSLNGASVNSMGAGFGRYTYGTGTWAATGRFGYRKAGDMMTPEGRIPGTYMNSYEGAAGFGIDKERAMGGFNFSFGGQSYGIPEDLDNPFEKVEVRIEQQMMQGRVNFSMDGFFDRAQLRLHASRFIQQELEIEIDGQTEHEEIEVQFNKLNMSSTLTLQHKPAGIFDRGAVGLNLYGRQLGVMGENAYTPDEDRITLGLFTFQEVPVTAGLRLQLGGRLDFLRAKSVSNHFSDIEKVRDAFVYSASAGFNYRPYENLEVGGQFARSHRYPMLEELFADGPHLCAGVYEIGSVDLKDEIGYGSDLFTRWRNGRVKAEIALFYNHFSNYIILQSTGITDQDSGFPVMEYQGDRVHLYGGETSVEMEVTGGLKVKATIDFVIGQRLSDSRENLPFMPPLRFSGTVEYDYGRGWTGFRVRAVNAQNRVAPEEDPTGGYVLLGFSAGYHLNSSGRHNIILRVENILDTKYRDHLSRVEERNYPMPGRNFNLAYRWFF